MFLFSWTPVRPSPQSSFQDGDLAFCILAGALESSQIHNTEREQEHTEAPSEATVSHDELGIPSYKWGVLLRNDSSLSNTNITRRLRTPSQIVFCHICPGINRIRSWTFIFWNPIIKKSAYQQCPQTSSNLQISFQWGNRSFVPWMCESHACRPNFTLSMRLEYVPKQHSGDVLKCSSSRNRLQCLDDLGQRQTGKANSVASQNDLSCFYTEGRFSVWRGKRIC